MKKEQVADLLKTIESNYPKSYLNFVNWCWRESFNPYTLFNFFQLNIYVFKYFHYIHSISTIGFLIDLLKENPTNEENTEKYNILREVSILRAFEQIEGRFK